MDCQCGWRNQPTVETAFGDNALFGQERRLSDIAAQSSARSHYFAPIYSCVSQEQRHRICHPSSCTQASGVFIGRKSRYVTIRRSMTRERREITICGVTESILLLPFLCRLSLYERRVQSVETHRNDRNFPLSQNLQAFLEYRPRPIKARHLRENAILAG
jgi:hypothetical protein